MKRHETKQRKIGQFVVYVLIFYVLSDEWVQGSTTCTVFWKSSPNVLIGGDIYLICHFIGDGCTGSQKWIGGPNNNVISLVKGILDHDKYSIELKENNDGSTYRLKIKHLSDSDFDVKYVCLCGFDKFEGVLRRQSRFTLTIAENRNNTVWTICMFANTSLAYDMKDLNRLWMRKPIESNASYDRIVLDKHFVERSVKDGYTLCIMNPSQSDFGFKYLLNYYSSLFDGVLKNSVFERVLTSTVGRLNNEDKDADVSDCTVTISVILVVSIISNVVLIIVVILLYRRRPNKKTSKDTHELNQHKKEEGALINGEN